MASVMKQIAEAEGKCCVYSFIQSIKDKDQLLEAERLGVSDRALRYWKNKVNKGTCFCSQTPTCERQ